MNREKWRYSRIPFSVHGVTLPCPYHTHTPSHLSLSLSLLNLCNLPLDELVYLSHLGRGDSKSIFIHPSVLGDIFISSLIVFFRI
jgi:hypothetical protein